MEHAFFELFGFGRQRRLTVFVPEESGVGQAGAQHAFVARDDFRAVVRRFHIGDNDEARRHFAVFVGHAKIFLIRAHGGNQNFLRDGHEIVVDFAHQRNGVFRQSRDFVQQAVVFQQFVARFFCQSVRFFGNDLTAFGGIDNHKSVADFLFVVRKVLDRKFRGGKESMSARRIA